MSKGLIDTHFHLDYYINHAELYNTINTLEQYTLCMTNSPGIYISCKKLYNETTFLKFALGFHPQNKDLTANEFTDFLELFPQANYIGEVGLDFSPEYSYSKEFQISCFEEIVKKCALSNKLLSVHLRHSEDQAISILAKYSPRKCIIHWFSGSISQLESLVNIGCYFSINCNMVNSFKKTQLLEPIPIDRILIESDGPFTKLKRRRYSPEMLEQAYQNIAVALNDKNLITDVYTNFKHILTA